MRPILNQLNKIIFITFLAANTVIFAQAMRISINWQQSEITHHHFFWSSDEADLNKFSLRSGFRPRDFLKIFYTDQIDGQFRCRQLSYFLEMLSFKTQQFFEIASFKNYALIFLHLINTGLIFILLKRYLAQTWAPLAAALLFLNSAAALSTILFPFRTAKLLIITIFLLGFLVLAYDNRQDRGASRGKRLNLFFMLFFLGLFTDEIAVFLFPPLMIYALYQEHFTPKAIKRICVKTLLTLLAFFFFSKIALVISARESIAVTGSPLIPHLKKLTTYLMSPGVLVDTPRAFLFYFLRRNFGYWDMTLQGLLALFSFSGIVVCIFLSVKKSIKKEYKLVALSCLAVILLKAVLLPHNSGIHQNIMPVGATFPCLLYFNFYHTYPDEALLIIGLGVLSAVFLSGGKTRVILFLSFISMINFSNLYHAKQGIKDALDNHGFYQSSQHVIPKIKQIKELLPLTQEGPVYLAFPSGSKPNFTRRLSGFSIWQDDPQGKGQQLNPSNVNYASLIPVQFLKSFEKGKFLMSLQNIKSPITLQNHNELLSASYYYDVPHQLIIDLKPMKRFMETHTLSAQKAGDPRPSFRKTLSLPQKTENDQQLLFWVKGAAAITLDNGEVLLKRRQDYGFSFQAFNFNLNDAFFNGKETIHISIEPVFNQHDVVIAGPFIGEVNMTSLLKG